jgi:hypothetical protein
MQITTISSINVNAREGVFISHFVGFIAWQSSSIAAANSFFGQKRRDLERGGREEE